MTHVLVFSTSDPKVILTEETISLLLHQARVSAPMNTLNWLSPKQAAELAISDNAVSTMAELRQAANTVQVDINVVGIKNRRKKLLLADMDSTIIIGETLDAMALLTDFGKAVANITARSINGEIDFEEALEKRVAMFAGQPSSLFASILATTKFTGGARTLVQTMRFNQAYCYLVSGGFMQIADPIAEQCGFQAAHANKMSIKDGIITGKIEKPILGCNSKAEIMAHYCKKHAIAADDAAAIGDGANDIAMLQEAGMGVAFNGKDILRAAIELQLSYTDLTGLLFLQGYREDEFVYS